MCGEGRKGRQQDGVQCQRALRTILVPILTSRGSPEMHCHLRAQTSTSHSLIQTALAELLPC